MGIRIKSPDPEAKINEAVTIADDDQRCVLWDGSHDADGRPKYRSQNVAWTVWSILNPEVASQPGYRLRNSLHMRCGRANCISKNHIVVKPNKRKNPRSIRAQERIAAQNYDVEMALRMPWRPDLKFSNQNESSR